MTPNPVRNNADPHYKQLLKNAQQHLLSMYKTKFGEDPDFESIYEASVAAPVMVDPQNGKLPDGSAPSRFMWINENGKKRIVWA